MRDPIVLQDLLDTARERVQCALHLAETFVVDNTLDNIRSHRSKEDLAGLSEYADSTLQETPVVAFTTKYVDKQGVVLAYYLGYRWADVQVFCLCFFYYSKYSLTSFFIRTLWLLGPSLSSMKGEQGKTLDWASLQGENTSMMG